MTASRRLLINLFLGELMNSKVAPLIESGLMAAITAILGMAATYLPVVGMFVEFFCPLPIVVLTVRRGLKFGAAASLVSLLILLMFMGPILAVRITLMFSLCGLMFGYCLRRGLSAVKCLIPTLIMSFVAQIISILMMSIILGVDIVDDEVKLLRESFAQSFQIYESMGVDPASIGYAQDQVESLIQLIAVLTPIILFLTALINVIVSYLITKIFFRKLNMKFAEPLPPFAQWRFPTAFLYLAAFSALGLYWGETRALSGLYFFAMNGLFFAVLIGLLQGLSLLSFLADKYKVSKFVRRIVFVILVLNFMLAQVVAFTGLFDMIFDYRKYFRK